MPEGDTIHKLAAALSPKLVGQAPHRVELTIRTDVRLAGHRITAVSARGKHLFIDFEPGLAIRTHLGMYGSWHRYAPQESWKKPARQASVVLDIGSDIFVCFNPKEVEVLRTGGVRERTLNTKLRVDLIVPDLDLSVVPKRARDFADGGTAVADILLDQRIACGIGNVYKSEVLFLHRLNPLAPLESVTDQGLLDVYRTAAALLRRNLGTGPRVTRFENDAAAPLWVYRRSGLPCFHCGTGVRYARLGRDWRATYWCPRCQPNRGTEQEFPDSSA